MNEDLTSASSISDQRQKIEQYKLILSSVLSSNDLLQPKQFIDHILSDDVPLVVSRQLLQSFAQELDRLEPETQKDIALYTLTQIQPRVVSFEEQALVIREKLVALYESEHNEVLVDVDHEIPISELISQGISQNHIDKIKRSSIANVNSLLLKNKDFVNELGFSKANSNKIWKASEIIMDSVKSDALSYIGKCNTHLKSLSLADGLDENMRQLYGGIQKCITDGFLISEIESYIRKNHQSFSAGFLSLVYQSIFTLSGGNDAYERYIFFCRQKKEADSIATKEATKEDVYDLKTNEHYEVLIESIATKEDVMHLKNAGIHTCNDLLIKTKKEFLKEVNSLSKPKCDKIWNATLKLMADVKSVAHAFCLDCFENIDYYAMDDVQENEVYASLKTCLSDYFSIPEIIKHMGVKHDFTAESSQHLLEKILSEDEKGRMAYFCHSRVWSRIRTEKANKLKKNEQHLSNKKMKKLKKKTERSQVTLQAEAECAQAGNGNQKKLKKKTERSQVTLQAEAECAQAGNGNQIQATLQAEAECAQAGNGNQIQATLQAEAECAQAGNGNQIQGNDSSAQAGNNSSAQAGTQIHGNDSSAQAGR